jgi:hypothetical protein
MISFLLILHICPGIFLMRVPTYLILVHTTYLLMHDLHLLCSDVSLLSSSKDPVVLQRNKGTYDIRFDSHPEPVIRTLAPPSHHAEC